MRAGVFLQVLTHVISTDVHQLYFEESGNPKGKPVVFLHGGPGGGTDPKMRRFFDPKRYRIVLFDQRGSGKSKPHASLEANTTWDLVADTEKIREHLGIEKWQVFGGSWGSTLALAYAETHPDRCTEIVLRGIFLLRRRELDWFYQEGASYLYPDRWEEYVAPIPPPERGDLMRAFHRRLTGDDHPSLASSHVWVARSLEALGRKGEALASYEAALEAYERGGPSEEPQIAVCARHIARCLAALERLDEAVEYAERADALVARLFPEGHAVRASTASDLRRLRDALAERKRAGAAGSTDG